MKFEGAVQVDRERIKKFLEAWEENSDWYDNRMKEVEEEARKFLEDWWNNKSWLGKWWHKNYQDYSTVRLWLRYEKGVYPARSLFYSNYIDDLIKIQELPELNRWENMLTWRRREEYKDIKRLYKCGEPVYLNPSQAGLVNEFLEMKSLKEVLVEWEKSKCE